MSKNTCRDSGNFSGTIATRILCKIIIEYMIIVTEIHLHKYFKWSSMCF